MRSKCLVTVCLCALAAPAAQATQIDVDLAGALNGGALVFGDAFDNNVFDTPPWFVASGAPGPESGTLLSLHGGDTIFAGIGIDRQFSAEAIAVVNLTSFGPGDSVTLLFLGEAPGDLTALTLAPGLGHFSDESGPLAFVPVADSPSATLHIVWTPAGQVTATINGLEIFNGANSFSAANAIGLSVVPEPATACLLLAGAAFFGRRKR